MNITSNVHVLYKSADGEILNDYWLSNLVVASGVLYICDHMASAAITTMDHIAFGSVSASVSASDTALGTLTYAKTCETTIGTAGRTIYTVSLTTAEGNCSGGYTLKEMAIQNHSSAGSIMARGILNDLDKTSNTTLDITWNVDYAAT